MQDENEICEEVVALIDRMDKFPEEFLNDARLHSRWGTVMTHIQKQGDDSVFTPAELRVLREKVQGLARLRMKKEILQNIMYGGESEVGQYGMAQESSSYYGTPLTPIGIANSSIGSTHAVLTSNTAGSLWKSEEERKTEETRRLIEQYHQMVREEAEEAKKAKRVKKATY